MRAFFFGNGPRRRFAVHHDAARETADHAVLICAPILQEYMRTHWALRKLATELARAGLPVLRFDYTGTGDSAGDLSDASVQTWVDDVGDAATELRDASGASRVSVVGLRFGATLATLAAAQSLKVRDLVLWDPVVNGADYLATLRRMHRRMLVDPNRFPQSVLDRVGRGQKRHFPSSDDELLGFAVPPPLMKEIEAIDLATSPPRRARRALVLTTHEDSALPGFSDALRDADVAHESRRESDAGDWDAHARIEDALICESIPRSIVTFLGQA